MKTLIAAALLLALTTPAFAFGDHNDWDCGNGINVMEGKGLTVFINTPTNPNPKSTAETTYPAKGRFDLKWSDKGIWLNGRKCLLLSDRLVHTKGCAENDDYICEELATGWLMTPDQIKLAIAKWRANWPGNTIRKP